MIFYNAPMNIQEITTSSPLYQQERQLRNLVLLRPIGIPDFGWEHFDAEAYHYVVTDENKVIACAILYPTPEQPQTAKLMQMAVDKNYQKQGIGSQLVRFIFANAAKKNINCIYCHSRHDAVAFYEKHQMRVEGEIFQEVGVDHLTMRIHF